MFAAQNYQRQRLLAGQYGAPAQRLHIVLGADQGTRQCAVAQDPAEILWPRLQVLLVDRVKLGDL
jgi:hypothetical protein